MLDSPEAPIRFGSGDLSLYRDIATMDPYPGYLNGILSLLLNSESPHDSLASQEQVAAPYFHRARASELAGLFDRQFPQSAQRPALHARLIEAYAIYGESDGVIRHGREFLNAFPSAPQRAAVELAMADAYARKAQPREEFAIYDGLLKELAAKADGVPLGAAAVPAAPGEGEQSGAEPARRPDAASGARSPEYARVLDRYISRLVSLDRVMDALAVCRREIDRNPDDPGLYERLAAFLDQNKLGAQVEGVYRKAMDRFPDASWTDKLARWYLRRQRRAEFEKLTADVIQIFSGSDLEKYFQELVRSSAVGPAAYRQVNLYAHRRFPNNLQFVRNLLDAYLRKETLDRRAYRELLRQYWFYDDHLRQEFLSSYGDEEQREADALRTHAGDTSKLAAADPWGARLVAETAAWTSHFEEAAPFFDALAAQFPGDPSIALRAAAVDRSLAAYRPEFAAKAAALVENVAKYSPGNHAALTEAGEIYADRERFSQARTFWNRIPQTEPGNAEGYLDAATVFWDYFQFDDALRLLAEGRQKLSDPNLYAYQAGAVYENKGDYERAVEEYLKGLATGIEGASPARARLLQLARRPALRPVIEARTVALVAGANPDRLAVSLRLAILEQQNRRDDAAAFLLALTRRGPPELLEDISAAGARLGFDGVREAVLQRQIALASDDVERIRLRLALARYYESKPDVPAARAVIEDVLRANPAILGVVRAATDFYWRNHLPEQAVDTLAAAARSSNAVFRKQFTFEAAQKAADSAKYARARELLAELLAAEPFDADYLAAMAGTYARAGEYQQLRDFYAARIADLSRAPIPAAERNQRVAGLRRGLIPALERLKDYAAAVDQYIEIVNRYPEDEDLVKDAALFAVRHGLQPRLAGYYVKATAESPKDVRLHVALARLETQFEDYPAAVSAYDRAIAVRPDRLDLRIAQAQLQEKLTRFDQAIEAYRNLYALSYRDPQWLLKVAELLARERRPAEAVKAVEEASIEGRPAKPELFFQAAATLEKWGLLQEAATFAARGVELAGPRLLIDQGEGAELYARVMTRLRRHEEAYRRLYSAQQAGMRLPQREAVPQLADLALRQIGQAANTFFTPEEKVSLAAFLEKARAAASNPPVWNDSLLQLAQLAGLKEREIRWRSESLLAEPDGPAAEQQLSRIVELEKARMQFADLGSLLERYWKVKSDHMGQLNLLAQAAQAYATAGDAENEFRVLSQYPESIDLGRYLEMLRTRDPDRRLSWRLAARRACNLLSSPATRVRASRGVARRRRRKRRLDAGLCGPGWAVLSRPCRRSESGIRRVARRRHDRRAPRQAGRSQPAVGRPDVVLFRLALRRVPGRHQSGRVGRLLAGHAGSGARASRRLLRARPIVRRTGETRPRRGGIRRRSSVRSQRRKRARRHCGYLLAAGQAGGSHCAVETGARGLPPAGELGPRTARILAPCRTCSHRHWAAQGSPERAGPGRSASSRLHPHERRLSIRTVAARRDGRGGQSGSRRELDSRSFARGADARRFRQLPFANRIFGDPRGAEGTGAPADRRDRGRPGVAERRRCPDLRAVGAESAPARSVAVPDAASPDGARPSAAGHHQESAG